MSLYDRSRLEIGKEIGGRYPGVHHWEHFDPRLLVCEAYLLPNSVLESRTLNAGQHHQQQQLLQQQRANNPAISMMNVQMPMEQQQKETDDAAAASAAANSSSECLVVSMFFNSETGLLVYDS